MAARELRSAIARIAHGACLLALLSLAGAAHAGTVVDDRGVEQAFSPAPARIVSMLPSLTETVCALQACERLVGVDDYSNWPERLRSVPRVGGLDDANVERIVALRPDVVLLARSARVIDRLESLGIRVVVLEPRSIDDMRRVIATVGRMLDRSAQADVLWHETDYAIRRIAAAVPAAARGTRVYFEVSSAPYAASEASFIGELLARLGAVDVVPGALGPFPKLNPEFVVRANPALIMIGDRNPAVLENRPGWRAIDALRHGRVCRFSAAEGDVLGRPGPRMAEAAAIMARCLAEQTK